MPKLLVVLAVVVASARPAPVRKINVFVFTQEAQSQAFVDPDTKDIADSAKDLRAALTTNEEATVNVVSQREKADVVIEVLSRARRFSGADLAMHATLSVRLSAGDYQKDIQGKSSLGLGPFGEAAGDVAHQVVRWIKANRQRLVEQSP